MSKEPQLPETARILTGRLTVADGRRLLLNEGGGRAPAQHAFQLFCAAAVAVSTAMAIRAGDVGAWHLALPLFAQYLGLLASIPVAYLFAPHPALRIEVVKCIGWLAIMPAFALAAVAVAAGRAQRSFEAEFAEDWGRAWKWIVESGMHWPMLFAFVGMAASMPGRVWNLHEHGPPFVSVGMGCACRILVFFGAAFLLPYILHNPDRTVWIMWGLLVFAELLSIYVVWDVQRRLAKIDASKGANT